jgi:hypothetical protein
VSQKNGIFKNYEKINRSSCEARKMEFLKIIYPWYCCRGYIDTKIFIRIIKKLLDKDIII